MRLKRICGLIFTLIVTTTLCGCNISIGKDRETIMTNESRAILEYLNCDYEIIPSNYNQKEIINRFNVLAKKGKTEGFYPLIIEPSNTLAEYLEIVLKRDGIKNTPESITAYRQTIIDTANEIDAKEFLLSTLDRNLGPYKDVGFELLGSFEPADSQNTISLLLFSDEIIIAKIPANNPWELAAWVPMGGFNECPLPAEQVAVFRYWWDEYGAVPTFVAHATWQMVLTKKPQSKEEAEVLAKEHFAFCPDTVLQGAETIRRLASSLMNSSVWFFWWD